MMRFGNLIDKSSLKRMKNDSKHSLSHAKHLSKNQQIHKHSRLATLRMNNMMTVNEASKLAGVSPGIIHRWESTGLNANDTKYHIKKYAKLLHISYKQLIELMR